MHTGLTAMSLKTSLTGKNMLEFRVSLYPYPPGDGHGKKNLISLYVYFPGAVKRLCT